MLSMSHSNFSSTIGIIFQCLVIIEGVLYSNVDKFSFKFLTSVSVVLVN